MSRVLVLAALVAMLSGCIMLPPGVARELEPVPHDHADHFHKP